MKIEATQPNIAYKDYENLKKITQKAGQINTNKGQLAKEGIGIPISHNLKRRKEIQSDKLRRYISDSQ